MKTLGGWQEKAKTEVCKPESDMKQALSWQTSEERILTFVSHHHKRGTPVSATETIPFLVLGCMALEKACTTEPRRCLRRPWAED